MIAFSIDTFQIIQAQLGLAWRAINELRRPDAVAFVRPLQAQIAKGKLPTYIPVSMKPTGIDEVDDLVNMLLRAVNNEAKSTTDPVISHETTWDRLERQARQEDAARAERRAAAELRRLAGDPRFQAPRPPHVNLVMRTGRR